MVCSCARGTIMGDDLIFLFFWWCETTSHHPVEVGKFCRHQKPRGTCVHVQDHSPICVHWNRGMSFQAATLPETNSSHLKIGHPKRKQSYSNHPFSGAFAVSFREGMWSFTRGYLTMLDRKLKSWTEKYHHHIREGSLHWILQMGVSKNRGKTPQNGWFTMENPIKIHDLVVKPPIFGNTQLALGGRFFITKSMLFRPNLHQIGFLRNCNWKSWNGPRWCCFILSWNDTGKLC